MRQRARSCNQSGQNVAGSGACSPGNFCILGLWNGISRILRAHLSKIYRFEIPILTVCLVKKLFRPSEGAHGRMVGPMAQNTLLYIYIQYIYILSESGVFTVKYQVEDLLYWPSDSEVNTTRPRFWYFNVKTEQSRLISIYLKNKVVFLFKNILIR